MSLRANQSARPKRLLTIGHSYVLGVNRVLAQELQIQSQGRWEVTAVAPTYFHGKEDIRPAVFQSQADEPIRVESVKTRFSNRVHFFTYGRQLKSILKEGFDLVHAWEEPYIFVGYQIASLTPKNTPLVFRTAQSLNKNYLPPFNLIERYCVNRMQGWLFSGGLVEKNLLGRPGYADKPRCKTPLGFDPNLIYVDRSEGREVKRKLGWNDSVPVLGFLGRFVKDKGIEVIIQALKQLQEPWRAIFVGNGPLLPKLQELSSAYPGRVALRTDVAHRDVRPFINAMDVLLAPSITMPNWREQFGRMIVEAFACGVPVIGSNSGEIPFVIDDIGVIVPENAATQLSNSIAELINDRARRKELSEAGLERAHQEFTWASIANKTLAFFDQLIV